MFSAKYHAVGAHLTNSMWVLVKAIDLGQGAQTVTSPSEKDGVSHWESVGLSLSALVASHVFRA